MRGVEAKLRYGISDNSILDRWARRVVEVVDARIDPVTMTHWGRHVHMSVGALRQLCRAAGVRPKTSLDLARMLRAVVWLQDQAWIPEAVLDCRDPRTLHSLLSRTGIPTDSLRNGAAPTPQVFLTRQPMLPQDGPHLHALHRTLSTQYPPVGDSTTQQRAPQSLGKIQLGRDLL